MLMSRDKSRLLPQFGAILLVLLALAAAPAAPSSSQETSGPTTQLSDMEWLADGMVRYVPPADWELVEKKADGMSAMYRSHDQSATITIIATPESGPVPDAARGQMAGWVVKNIRESVTKAGQQFAIPPRVERDDRFFLRVHDAVKVENGVVERIQLYRPMGLNLVSVAATGSADKPESVKDAFTKAEQLLATARSSRGAKRAAYPHARLQAIVPVDWTEQRSDQSNGLVATYTDPKDPAEQIILSVRIIPKAAQQDKAKLDALAGTMADQERKLPAKFAGAKVEQQPAQPAAGEVKRTRVKVGEGDSAVIIETRYVVVGDVLASVRSIGREGAAGAGTATGTVAATGSGGDSIGAITDKFVAGLKPNAR
jgi:hypothetical protein